MIPARMSQVENQTAFCAGAAESGLFVFVRGYVIEEN